MPAATCAAWRPPPPLPCPPPPPAAGCGTVRSDASSYRGLPAAAVRTAAPHACRRWSGSDPRGPIPASPRAAPAAARPPPPPPPPPPPLPHPLLAVQPTPPAAPRPGSHGGEP